VVVIVIVTALISATLIPTTTRIVGTGVAAAEVVRSAATGELRVVIPTTATGELRVVVTTAAAREQRVAIAAAGEVGVVVATARE